MLHALQLLVVCALIVFALMTLTGNFATKRFFDGFGLGLRARYVVAAFALVAGIVLLSSPALLA